MKKFKIFKSEFEKRQELLDGMIMAKEEQVRAKTRSLNDYRKKTTEEINELNNTIANLKKLRQETE